MFRTREGVQRWLLILVCTFQTVAMIVTLIIELLQIRGESTENDTCSPPKAYKRCFASLIILQIKIKNQMRDHSAPTGQGYCEPQWWGLTGVGEAKKIRNFVYLWWEETGATDMERLLDVSQVKCDLTTLLTGKQNY